MSHAGQASDRSSAERLPWRLHAINANAGLASVTRLHAINAHAGLAGIKRLHAINANAGLASVKRLHAIKAHAGLASVKQLHAINAHAGLASVKRLHAIKRPHVSKEGTGRDSMHSNGHGRMQSNGRIWPASSYTMPFRPDPTTTSRDWPHPDLTPASPG